MDCWKRIGIGSNSAYNRGICFVVLCLE